EEEAQVISGKSQRVFHKANEMWATLHHHQAELDFEVVQKENMIKLFVVVQEKLKEDFENVDESTFIESSVHVSVEILK
ncbi:uncharacterized protein V6R79_011197, partial [Siganus canaliculatus]